MKRKLIACLLALMLCLSLCACGAYRGGAGMNNAYTNDGTGDTNRTGTTNGTGMTNGTGGTERSGGTYGTDMVPDKNDGIVRDGNADDGVVDSTLPMTSPNVTRNP